MKAKTMWNDYLKNDLRYGLYAGSLFWEYKADIRWLNIFGVPNDRDGAIKLFEDGKIIGDE